MLQRELIRTGAGSACGALLGIYMAVEGASLWSIPIAAVYILGLLYAGRLLFSMLASVFKTYFQYQMMSFFFRPLLGTVLCLCILTVGLAAVLLIGWAIGLFRCGCAIYTAAQTDREWRF